MKKIQITMVVETRMGLSDKEIADNVVWHCNNSTTRVLKHTYRGA